MLCATQHNEMDGHRQQLKASHHTYNAAGASTAHSGLGRTEDVSFPGNHSLNRDLMLCTVRHLYVTDPNPTYLLDSGLKDKANTNHCDERSGQET